MQGLQRSNPRLCDRQSTCGSEHRVIVQPHTSCCSHSAIARRWVHSRASLVPNREDVTENLVSGHLWCESGDKSFHVPRPSIAALRSIVEQPGVSNTWSRREPVFSKWRSTSSRGPDIFSIRLTAMNKPKHLRPQLGSTAGVLSALSAALPRRNCGEANRKRPLVVMTHTTLGCAQICVLISNGTTFRRRHLLFFLRSYFSSFLLLLMRFLRRTAFSLFICSIACTSAATLPANSTTSELAEVR